MTCYNSEWLNRLTFRHREDADTNSNTISYANTATSNTENITTEIPVSNVTDVNTSTTSVDVRWFNEMPQRYESITEPSVRYRGLSSMSTTLDRDVSFKDEEMKKKINSLEDEVDTLKRSIAELKSMLLNAIGQESFAKETVESHGN